MKGFKRARKDKGREKTLGWLGLLLGATGREKDIHLTMDGVSEDDGSPEQERCCKIIGDSGQIHHYASTTQDDTK